MNILTNLVIKNLKLNKKKTLVTVISILLSAAMITSVSSLVLSFQKFMQNVVIEEEGSYQVSLDNITKEKYEEIKEKNNIKKIYSTKVIGYSKDENLTSEYPKYIRVENHDDNALKQIKLKEGRYPEKDNEILMDIKFIEEANLKYKINDTINLNVGDRYINNEKVDVTSSYIEYEENGIKYEETLKNTNEKEYIIVGFGKVLNSDFYTSFTAVVKNKNEKSLNKVYIEYKNVKDVYKNTKELNIKKEDIVYHDDLLRWYGVLDNDEANKVIYRIALIIISVIMIASIIVINNSFTISLLERKKQLGIMSSIGTTKKQMKNMVLKEGLILGLISIPLGIIVGLLGMYITLEFINNLDIFGSYMETKLRLHISIESIYVTLIFGFLTIFISSLIPAIKSSKTSPIDAIRQTSDIKIKGKKLKTSFLIKKLFKVEGELASKNLKRNKKKYRSTIISLFVAIILFMAINGFAEYSLRSAKKLYNTYNYNIDISGKIEDIEKLEKENKLERYTKTSSVYYNLYLEKEDFNKKVLKSLKETNFDTEKNKYYVQVVINSLGEKEYNRYKELLGIKTDGLILLKNSNYYDMKEKKFYQLKLTNHKENDTLNLEDYDKNLLDIKIVKITDEYPLGFNSMDQMGASLIGFAKDDVVNKNNQDEYKRILINSKNAEEETKILKKYVKDNNLNINVFNINEMMKMLDNIILAVSIFLYGFIILVSLITITNIINTITTSIYIRRREFATLKAIGMTDKDFNKMIRYESIFHGLKALIYALPLGIYIDYQLFKNVNAIFVYDYEIPIKPILVVITFVFIIIFITMTYAVRKIKNDNIIDVIKDENI